MSSFFTNLQKIILGLYPNTASIHQLHQLLAPDIPWADDADQLRGLIFARGKRGVNALGECGRIDVVAGADDDSRMSALGYARQYPR
jgi:hypothetical protein